MQTNNKLREAAVKCCVIALQWQADEAAGVAGTTDRPHARSAAEAVIDMEFELNAALAAPARNCDVGTAQEQIERWQAFCNRYDDNCTGCSCEAADTWNYTYCFAKWAQMPCEEGGAK